MRNASALISSASKRASFHPTHAPPTPTSHNHPISTTQNKIHIPNCPPANMANPCSGSDVATIPSLATLSAAVVQAAGHCPGCAAAVLMMHKQQTMTAAAAAAVPRSAVEGLDRAVRWPVSGGCRCACSAACRKRTASFLRDCKRHNRCIVLWQVTGADARDPMTRVRF